MKIFASKIENGETPVHVDVKISGKSRFRPEQEAFFENRAFLADN
jgi:hypothetical protein